MKMPKVRLHSPLAKSFDTTSCHENCLTVSRFDLILQFSILPDASGFKTISYSNYDEVDTRIVAFMQRHNINVSRTHISVEFRQQFVNFLKCHQTQIRQKRLRYDQPKGIKFIETLKIQVFCICLLGQTYSRLDLLLLNKFNNLSAEHKVTKARCRLLSVQITDHVISARNNKVKTSALQNKLISLRHRINSLRLCLSNRNAKMRQQIIRSPNFHCGANSTYLAKRKLKCKAVKFLKQVVAGLNFKVSKVSFIPPGGSSEETFDFDKKKYVKHPDIVTPELAVQHIDEVQASMATYAKMRRRLPFLPSKKSVISLRNKYDNVIPTQEMTDMWLKPNVEDSVLNLPNYNVLRHDWILANGGGVAILTKWTLSYKMVNIPDTYRNLEICAVDVLTKSLEQINVRFICLYRSPDSGIVYLNAIINCLRVLIDDCDSFIICGDFNLRFDPPSAPDTFFGFYTTKGPSSVCHGANSYCKWFVGPCVLFRSVSALKVCCKCTVFNKFQKFQQMQ